MKLKPNETLIVGMCPESKVEMKRRHRKGIPAKTYSYIAVKEPKTKRREHDQRR